MTGGFLHRSLALATSSGGRRWPPARTRDGAPAIDSPDPGPEATPISPTARRGAAGLCERCAHHLTQTSARGGVFHRCARADDDERFPRYPPIPVAACAGFETDADEEQTK